jgi:hypothetical protein
MKRLFLLTALILCLASCSREPAPPKPASRPYDAGLRDGSVIFWRGGLLVKPILKHNRSRWGAPRPWIGAQHSIGVKAAGVKGIKMAGGQIRGRFASRRSERFAAARLASPPNGRI